MLSRIILLAVFLFGISCSREAGVDETSPAPAQSESEVREPDPEWDEITSGLERREGFLDLFVDEDGGKIYAVLPAPGADGVSLRAIHASGLTAGLGSNPIGLDRGLFDSGSVVAFRKIGNKVFAARENWAYRASAENPLEKKAVEESFARSFLWAQEISARGPEGELLVELNGFMALDSLNVRGALKSHPQGGSFTIDQNRSAPDFQNILVFPDNVELDFFMTLTSDKPGAEVIATAPEARAVTLVQHHSLVRLPGEGFTSRKSDQRSGSIDIVYYDFSAPLEGQVEQAFARRFRLNKQTPGAVPGPAAKPLVFYVDRGAPERIRDALIEGASWWADAFEAAGFPNSFRVEVLPEGVHPRDIRYNVILWTHRQTRGWSYGGGVSDPRTGEMLKASVILGSQRVRQDRMIFEGLAGTGKTGTTASDDPVEIALSRIRQLSAHEVGHTLGFAHNFAGSSNDRASVMDYPAPLVTASEAGGLDFSNAYDAGIGEWDKRAAIWLYAEFAEGADVSAELNKIIEETYASGLRFIGDREARSVGTGHPYASVWDNGADAVTALNETMRVRQIALDNFGLRSLKQGQPQSDLKKIIVPVYLYHRYQVDAAAKLIGGYEFTYGLKADQGAQGVPVAAARQRDALNAILATIAPDVLDLPDTVLQRLTPALGRYGVFAGGREEFDGAAEPVFDLLAAADSAAAHSFNALLHPARAARMFELKRRDANMPGLREMLEQIEQFIFVNPGNARERAISRRIQTRFVSSLIEFSENQNATPETRAAAEARLRAIAGRLSPSLFGGDQSARDHNLWLARRINAHLERAAGTYEPGVKTPDIPPGSPIGASASEECWHCDSSFTVP